MQQTGQRVGWIDAVRTALDLSKQASLICPIPAVWLTIVEPDHRHTLAFATVKVSLLAATWQTEFEC